MLKEDRITIDVLWCMLFTDDVLVHRSREGVAT